MNLTLQVLRQEAIIQKPANDRTIILHIKLETQKISLWEYFGMSMLLSTLKALV